MILKGKKILVVEDDFSSREIMVNYFKTECEADVTEAADGGQGFVKFSEKPYEFDIVLTDFNMEPVDGLSMIDKIKSAFPDCKAEFAVLSTEKSEDHQSRSKNLGIRLWKLKPFDGGTLQSALSKLMTRKIKTA